jgi:hypothetical protein
MIRGKWEHHYDLCWLPSCETVQVKTDATSALPLPIIIITIIIMNQSIIRQIHSPLQSEFSINCDQVLPLSISSILFFP